MPKKKLMWISQSATATTGLGKSTRYILNSLKKEFDVINLGYNFVPKNIEPMGIDYPTYGLDLKNATDPNLLGDQVRDKIVEHSPDITVFFGDVRYFLYLPSIIRDLPDTTLVGYITVDCCNLPVTWLPTVSTFDNLITTSQFAADEILKRYDRECSVIYLGHDPTVFNTENKRRISGLEDKRLVAFRVDRNQTRKNWPATFDLWEKWCADKDVNLIVHTRFDKEEGGAGNLKEYSYGLENFRRKATTSSAYISRQEDFSILMKSADVFLTTSMGEGFGLSILEAAACGVPTLGIDFSASGELIRSGAGVAVPPSVLYANQEGVKMALPNMHEFNVELDKMYSDKRHLKELSDRALEWSKSYTWKETTQKLLQELTKDIGVSILKLAVTGSDGTPKNLALERII